MNPRPTAALVPMGEALPAHPASVGDEQWRPVVGYEGFFEVSDHGGFRSVTRTDRLGRVWEGKAIKAFPAHAGHLRVQLRREGTVRHRYLHVLVLEAWIGPRPPGMQCCHNDGNPANNHVNNLRWDSPVANCMDTFRHGTGSVRLTEQEVRSIRADREAGHTIGAIARRMNVSRPTIQDIVHRRTWRHI